MKRAPLILYALLFAFLQSACHGDTGSILGDTAAAPDTSNANLIVGENDAEFVKKVAAGCLAEISIGKLAKQKGKDKRVKNFGAMMVKDLNKGHGRLEDLARLKKIPLPQAVSPEDQLTIDSLAAKNGKDFDRAYLNQVKTDYQKALALFETTSQGAFDPQIKAFAAKNILTIHRHLDLINAMHASMK